MQEKRTFRLRQTLPEIKATKAAYRRSRESCHSVQERERQAPVERTKTWEI